MIIDRYVPLWGGAENQLRQLMPHLRNCGCGVSVLTRRWTTDLAKEEHIDDVPVHRVGLPGRGVFTTASYMFGLFLFVLLRKNSFDIIHTHGAAQLGALGCVLAKMVNKPNVAKVASADRIPILEKTVLGRIVLGVFKCSTAIICLSTEIDGQLKRIGVSRERIKYIKNAVDPLRFSPLSEEERKRWRTERGFGASDPVVVFLGHFRPIKGLDVLLDAWPAVLKASASARLLILGSGEFIKDSIEERLLGRIKEAENLHIYYEGETDKPELYLGIADIVAVPSRMEGFPNVVLEAMAAAVATVSSNTCGIADLVRHGETGVLVPGGDSKAMAQAIAELLADPVKRRSLGQNAREYVQNNLTFAYIGQKYCQLYAGLV